MQICFACFFQIKKKIHLGRSPKLSYSSSLSLVPLSHVVLQQFVLFSWLLCSQTTLRILALSWKAAAHNQISSAHSSQYVQHQMVREVFPSQTDVPRKQTNRRASAEATRQTGSTELSFTIWRGRKQNKQLNFVVCDVRKYRWKCALNHSWTEDPDLQISEIWGCAGDWRALLSPRVGCMYTW